MARVIVGPGNRITIPGEIRRKMGLLAGDRVEFVKVDGEYRIRKHNRSEDSVREETDFAKTRSK